MQQVADPEIVKKIQEAAKIKQEIWNRNNACKHCARTPGKYQDKVSQKVIGVFMYADERGFMVCNLCAEMGLLINKKKMTKSERRQFKQFRREVGNAKDIKHITLDVKGQQVL